MNEEKKILLCSLDLSGTVGNGDVFSRGPLGAKKRTRGRWEYFVYFL